MPVLCIGCKPEQSTFLHAHPCCLPLLIAAPPVRKVLLTSQAMDAVLQACRWVGARFALLAQQGWHCMMVVQCKLF